MYYRTPAPPPGDGAALDTLVGFFAPDGPTDAVLLRALFVTQVWGGPGGARPVLLIRGPASDPGGGGRGVGKSSVGDLAARLVGGSVELGTGDKIEKLKERLLSPASVGLRVVRWDNIKTDRVSNSDFEGLVTASMISGKRMYVGEGRRPNLFTYILTMNGGELSKDIAQRAMVLRLRRHVDQPGWQANVEAFIDANRNAIFADAVAVFDRAAVPTAGTAHTRWARWEAGVLAGCVGDSAELRRVGADLSARQRVDDADDTAAGIVAQKLRKLAETTTGTPAGYAGRVVCELDKDALTRLVNEVENERHSVAKAMACLGRYLDHIPELVKVRPSGGHAHYFFVGDEHPNRAELRTFAPLRDAAAAYRTATASRVASFVPHRPTDADLSPSV